MYMNQLLQVTVRERKGIVYAGSAEAVSGINDVGPFDVLPEHANFVSVITKELILHLDRRAQHVPFERGIMRVHANTIEVYVGI